MKYKNIEQVKNVSYINKDFQSLWSELLELIPKLTNKWAPSDANESDPLAVLIKLLALFSDKANYNFDKGILEAFPQTLTQERSAYNVYDILGYKAPYYRSATTTLTLRMNTAYTVSEGEGDDATQTVVSEFWIPKFTQFCDSESTIVYTTLEDVHVTQNQTGTKRTVTPSRVDAVQGTVHDYELDGVRVVKLNNLDSQNRLYFNERNISEYNIYISSSSAFTRLNEWTRVDNIYQAALGERKYEFGIDPVTGACYIEFPQSISNLIGDGLYIKYILSDGAAGNVKAYAMKKFLNTTYPMVLDADGVSFTKYTSTGGGEIKSLQDFIAVTNEAAVTSGANPATIDEMYSNYKKVQNTFETLVTLLDYENYIFDARDEDNDYIVSNIRASDRTNDLYYSYQVQTLDVDGQERRITKQRLVGGEEPLSAYSLRFYPLKYQDATDTLAAYNNTFELDNDAIKTVNNTSYIFNPSSKIASSIQTVKTINHDILTPARPLIVLCGVSAIIYLSSTVTQSIATTILGKIKAALYQNFEARQIDFGYELDYNELLTVIQNADDRIQYVALDRVSYPNDTISEDLKDLYVDQMSVNVDTIRRACIHAGLTPWTTFDDTFNWTYSQFDTQKRGGGTGTAEIYDDTDHTIKYDYYIVKDGGVDTIQLGKTHGIEADLIDGTEESVDLPLRISSIKLTVKAFDPSQDYIETLSYENLQLFAPDYRDVMNYSNYLYYIIHLNNVTDGEGNSVPKIIAANTPYRLEDGEYLYFYETKQDIWKAIDNGNSLSSRKPTNPQFSLNSGDAFRPSFDVMSNSDIGIVSGTTIEQLRFTKDLSSLNNGKQIAKIDYNRGSIIVDPENAEVKSIYCFTNSQQLVDALSNATGEVSYTLLTDEYFIFQMDGDNAFTIINSGNTIIFGSELNITALGNALDRALNSNSNVDWSAILQGDASELDSSTLARVEDATHIEYQINQLLTFGPGYSFHSVSSGGFAESSNNWFISDGEGGYELQTAPFNVDPQLEYKLIKEEGASYTSLPVLLAGDRWTGLRTTHAVATATGDLSLEYSYRSSHVPQISKVVINYQFSDIMPTSKIGVYPNAEGDVQYGTTYKNPIVNYLSSGDASNTFPVVWAGVQGTVNYVQVSDPSVVETIGITPTPLIYPTSTSPSIDVYRYSAPANSSAHADTLYDAQLPLYIPGYGAGGTAHTACLLPMYNQNDIKLTTYATATSGGSVEYTYISNTDVELEGSSKVHYALARSLQWVGGYRYNLYIPTSVTPLDIVRLYDVNTASRKRLSCSVSFDVASGDISNVSYEDDSNNINSLHTNDVFEYDASNNRFTIGSKTIRGSNLRLVSSVDGTILTVTLRDTTTDSFICGNPNVVRLDAVQNIYKIGTSYTTIGDILGTGNPIKLIDINTYLGAEDEFNPTYCRANNTVIPLDKVVTPDSQGIFNRAHPYNRYVLPKIDFNGTSFVSAGKAAPVIKISELSIKQ